MLCHPYYLEDPWDIHWNHEGRRQYRHLWWLVGMLVCLALFLIGVGITSGLVRVGRSIWFVCFIWYIGFRTRSLHPSSEPD